MGPDSAIFNRYIHRYIAPDPFLLQVAWLVFAWARAFRPELRRGSEGKRHFTDVEFYKSMAGRSLGQSNAIRFAIAIFVLGSAWAPKAQADGCGAQATQSDLDVCAARGLNQADEELNVSYQQVLDRLKNGEATKLLMTSQRAWLAFRDAECAFQASASAGGTIYPMVISQCREALTRQRSQQLKAYLQCKEGDLSCPVSPK